MAAVSLLSMAYKSLGGRGEGGGRGGGVARVDIDDVAVCVREYAP